MRNVFLKSIGGAYLLGNGESDIPHHFRYEVTLFWGHVLLEHPSRYLVESIVRSLSSDITVES